ncbi:MAG: hypothetical protein MSG64_06395 [Pyrinomonadaceae bacterium MAG19_C2-C3]|nr:hypothetical protein [Pyrinomonadaceae bacterium MAG19_C2-C3]
MNFKNYTEFVRAVLKADGVEREFKSTPIFLTAPGTAGKTAVDATKAVADSRTVEGIVAVHGNVDDGADRSFPGAFTKTITEGRNRAKHLWNHSFSNPPTAAILDLKEVTAADLPKEIFDYAPEATGGLYVKRQYLKTQRGDEILEGIVSSAISEMSYGYAAIKYDFETLNADTVNELRVRNLREVKLYDTSDVLWGMNYATVAASGKALDEKDLPLEALLVAFKNLLTAEGKEGRRNSDKDIKAMQDIHQLLLEIEPAVCGVTDNGKQATTEAETSRAANEPTVVDALTLAKHRVLLSEMETLLNF